MHKQPARLLFWSPHHITLTIGLGCPLLLWSAPTLVECLASLVGKCETGPDTAFQRYAGALVAGVVPALVIHHFTRPNLPRVWRQVKFLVAVVISLIGPLWFGGAFTCLRSYVLHNRSGFYQADVYFNSPGDPLRQHLVSLVNQARMGAGVCLCFAVALTVHLFLSRQISGRRLIGMLTPSLLSWSFLTFYLWWIIE